MSLKYDIVAIMYTYVFSGFGKSQICVVLVSSLCFYTTLVEAFSISYVLPSTKCDLPMTMSQKGFLAAASNLGKFKMTLELHFLPNRSLTNENIEAF
jgi:hypothetical protein